MKKIVVAAAIGLLLGACGSPANSNLMPTPRPQVNVTELDHAVTIHVGQKLELALRAANGMNNWTHPETSDASVLAHTVDPAATAALGVTLAAFLGIKPGTAQVTSNASPRCPPGAACPMYIAVLSLNVMICS
jgi:hypothetical protein